MLFPPQSDPRVFALPVGCDFSQTLVDGLRTRMVGQPPEAWARVTLYVNTRRAQRRLEALFSSGPACLLPEIKVISDLGAEPGQPAAQSRFMRHLALADLVGAFLESQPDLGSKTAMFGLSESLAALHDEMTGEGVGFDALERINPAGLSGHWQRNLKFLNILNDYEKSLPDQVFSGAEARQRAGVEALASRWQKVPPQGPVIVAGSTGSRATTARLMQAVAALPQGAVVLPGFDFTSPDDLWRDLGEEHPQFGFAALGGRIGFDPANMAQWHEAPPKNTARNALISLALRPAPVTPHWLTDAPKLAKTVPDATARLTLLNAPDARAEATAIAIRLREALALGQMAALVTPDRNLTRRVAAQLGRWGIQPDDSAGHPAKLTPPGVFLRMVAQAMGRPMAPVNLIEILKHPLCMAGDKEARKTHLNFVRSFESEALRGGPAEVDLAGYTIWTDKAEGASAWLESLETKLVALSAPTPQPVAVWARRHRQVAEALASAEALWDKSAGQEVLKVFEALALGENHSTRYTAHQYRALFAGILERLEVRDDPLQAHPDIAIWGTLEARVQSPDLVIVAGMNEGTWPKVSGHDPWFNRDMRRQCGLMLPERQIGLSAHDFQQALGAEEVVISRSLRDGDAPSVASRWLLRLQNLLGGMAGGEAALEAMQARGQRLLDLASILDSPAGPPVPARRPCPSPPLAARARRLSVTGIETLIRDPYASYARTILKLYPLDPLSPTPDARMRGTVLHAILERFVRATMEGLPERAETLYNQCVEDVLTTTVPWPATRALWRQHYHRARAFFLQSEQARRAVGAPFGTEIKGKRMIKGKAFDVTLTATADRIDITAGGGAVIYDYKAGNPQSVKQIKAFNVQLPLEGSIADAQGFEGLNARHTAALELVYLGSKPAIVSFKPEDEVMVDVWQRVVGFINEYQLPEKGYAARLRPELISFEGDYDHLSRRGEWQDDDPYEAEALQ